MESKIQEVSRGDWLLFIRPGEKMHTAVNRVEKFMQNNWGQFETVEGQETDFGLCCRKSHPILVDSLNLST